MNKKKLFISLGLIVSIVAIVVFAVVFFGGKKKQDVLPEQPATDAGISAKQRAQDAYTSYLAQKPVHAGGLFLYETDGYVFTLTGGAVTGNSKTVDEAKGDYTAKEVAPGLSLLYKADDPYIHAVPESQGVKNTIARAYQLTDIQWTPLAEVPGVVSQSGEFSLITHDPGVTYQGIPYSGTTATDTYVGMNVSLETFLTALKNKNSVLYTENLFSTNPKAASYYGTVCSKFVQYSLDITGSYNSQNVHKIPGVATIATAGKYTVDQIKLGDIVVNPKVHTTICTDILYDVDGNVAYIEISEAVLPRVRRKMWTPEEFYKHFEGYRLCRYQDINKVPAAPDLVSAEKTYALMPRFGDKYNYTVSAEKGIVDILESGYSKAVILRDGAIIDEVALTEATKTFQFDRSIPGYLEMYLQKADGTRSGSVCACVVESAVSVIDNSKFVYGMLTVSFEGSSGTPLYIQVSNGQSVFCSIKDTQDNQATIYFPPEQLSGKKNIIRVAYQNEYGIYLSEWFNAKD